MTPAVPLLLALALLVMPAASARIRLTVPLSGTHRPAPRRPRIRPLGSDRGDPLQLGSGWDLLSTGMRCGIPVPVIVRVVAAEVGGSASRALGEVADLLALGADPVAAWEPALRHPDTADLARAARRTARIGSGLAAAAADAAVEARAAVDAHAEARAQRAGVWVAMPLGLCFLPGFICLGVLPVVAGMVQRLTASW